MKLLKSASKGDMEVKNRYKRYVIGMIDAELGLRELADKIGVSEQMIFYVMRGERTSARVEKALNKILKIGEVA